MIDGVAEELTGGSHGGNHGGRQAVLGMGVGHCRLDELVELLARLPNAQIFCEEPPLLHWKCSEPMPAIRERLARLRATTTARVFGDVASVYLPYVEDAIACEPGIRVVCLKRDRDYTVTAFVGELDEASPVPTNHWAEHPARGWFHDPFRTRLYPQYDTADREEGIRRYWTEYYLQADDLQRRYPNNVRVFDSSCLDDGAGRRSILEFVAGDRISSFVVPDREAIAEKQREQNRAQPSRSRRPRDRFDPGRCVVLVPFYDSIVVECDAALRELERRGYEVRRIGGNAQIDHARCQMATNALRDGFEETLWIDADIGFDPDSVNRLRAYPHGVVGGLYVRKGMPDFAVHLLPNTPSVSVGDAGGLIEVFYLGTGFMLVRRAVYLDIQRRCNLPMCNERFGSPLIPFFLPIVKPSEDGHWYLGDDFAFCERVRQAGHRIYGDTSIRLWHIGRYRYSWEDIPARPPTMSAHVFPVMPRQHAGRRLPPTDYIRHPEALSLMERFPWPDPAGATIAKPARDGLAESMQQILRHSVARTARVLATVGPRAGSSARLMTDIAPQALVVALGAYEAQSSRATESPGTASASLLDGRFANACADRRERIIPMPGETPAALQVVSDAGVQPDVIAFDGSEGEALGRDLETSLRLFPQAILIGAGWDIEAVRRGVEQVLRKHGLQCDVLESAWRIAPW